MRWGIEGGGEVEDVAAPRSESGIRMRGIRPLRWLYSSQNNGNNVFEVKCYILDEAVALAASFSSVRRPSPTLRLRHPPTSHTPQSLGEPLLGIIVGRSVASNRSVGSIRGSSTRNAEGWMTSWWWLKDVGWRQHSSIEFDGIRRWPTRQWKGVLNTWQRVNGILDTHSKASRRGDRTPSHVSGDPREAPRSIEDDFVLYNVSYAFRRSPWMCLRRESLRQWSRL